ncbi:MAG: DNA-directed RNA polymerase subunit K [archaeon]
MEQQTFTRYEMARILGARALQIAMDAPMLLKISEDELKIMKYDALLIAEKEFNEGALPITIIRPMPIKRKDKLAAIKEEKVDDEEIKKKEKEVEKEIVADPDEYSLVKDEEETTELETHAEEQ